MMAAMPREGDPRVVVRMSPTGFAAVKAAADEAGVSVGGLVRECAERFAVQVALEAREGRVRLRRASSGGTSRPSPAGRQVKSEADRPPVVPAAASRQGALGPAASVVPASGAGRADVFRRALERRS